MSINEENKIRRKIIEEIQNRILSEQRKYDDSVSRSAGLDWSRIAAAKIYNSYKIKPRKNFKFKP